MRPGPAPAPGGYFGWVGVGGALPSDAECAARVRRGGRGPSGQRRLQRHDLGSPRSGEFPRATGNFTGSTDDIIQWAACKWGFDEDTLRAQVAKESYWTQTNLGDWTDEPGQLCPRPSRSGPTDGPGNARSRSA